MNHTKNIAIILGMLAIAAALTGTIAISIQQQTAAAQTTTDLEDSGTDSKFKQKDKNNCTGFTFCCNSATQAIPPPRLILIC